MHRWRQTKCPAAALRPGVAREGKPVTCRVPARTFRRVCLGLVAVLLLGPTTAGAHQTGLSYLDLQVEGALIKASLDLPPVDLRQALDLDADHNGQLAPPDIAARQEALTGWLGSSLRVMADGVPCRAEPDRSELHSAVLLTVRARFQCPQPAKDLDLSVHFADAIGDGFSTFVHLQAGELTRQSVVSSRDPSVTFTLSAGNSAWSWANVSRFLGLGIEHIFTGYDHILFLIALLMLGGSLRRIIAIATSFTAAHTITLSLAALGKVALPSRFIESAIAASIAYVAVENFWHARPVLGEQEPFVLRWRWAITFFFGLVHGFGFASALGDLGLTRAELPVALACFNVGVELGQLVIITLAYPLLTYAGRQVWYRPQGVRFASVGVLSIAVYWFMMRAFLS